MTHHCETCTCLHPSSCSQPQPVPAAYRDLQWRARGYHPPCATPNACSHGWYNIPVRFSCCWHVVLWIFAVVGFITLLLTLTALALAWSNSGLWFRLIHFRIGTDYNVTLRGNLPPVHKPDAVIGSQLYNVSAIQFDNNYNDSAAANARLAVYNPSAGGLRDHGNGSLELLTACEGVLKPVFYASHEQRLGLRTRHPASVLDVNGNVTSRECYNVKAGLQLACLRDDPTPLLLLGDAGGSNMQLQAKDAVDVYVDGSSVVEVDSGGMLVTGLVESTGGFMMVSDARVKTNVQLADGSSALAHIAALRVVQYEFKPEFAAAARQAEGVKHTGLLAQEAESVIPQLVHTVAEFQLGELSLQDFKLVNNDRLLMELLLAVQQLQAKVAQLEQQLSG